MYQQLPRISLILASLGLLFTLATLFYTLEGSIWYSSCIVLSIISISLGIFSLFKTKESKGLTITAIIIAVLIPALIGSKQFNFSANHLNTTDTITTSTSTSTSTSTPDLSESSFHKNQVVDTKRQADLHNLVMGIEFYSSFEGQLPDSLQDLVDIGAIGSLPTDPQQATIKVGTTLGKTGEYTYVKLKKFDTPDNGYAIVTKISNLENANATKSMVESWIPETDAKSIQLCEIITQNGEGECSVSNLDDLRYAIVG